MMSGGVSYGLSLSRMLSRTLSTNSKAPIAYAYPLLLSESIAAKSLEEVLEPQMGIDDDTRAGRRDGHTRGVSLHCSDAKAGQYAEDDGLCWPFRAS